MASRYQIISAMAAEESTRIVSSSDAYAAFLRTAANNYKYRFLDQLLIHAQKPEATACAEISVWNRLGRWVNRGSTGIALLTDQNAPYRLRYVFDVSDTNSRTGREVTLWQMEDRYQPAVIESIENRFGSVEQAGSFGEFLKSISENVVEDNLTDYYEQLGVVCQGSTLADLDEESRNYWLQHAVLSSVTYMTMYRCGVDPMQHLTPNDLFWISYFNTSATVSVLGCASSSISEMVLREIGITVRSLQKQEQIRTFDSAPEAGYNGTVNQQIERSTHDESDLYDAGRLPPAESGSAGGTADWEIWNAAADIPPQSPGSNLHRDAPDGNAEQPSGGDRQESQRDDESAGIADEANGGRDGEAESQRSDGVGSEDEQHSDESGGSGDERPDLQLTEMLPSVEEQQKQIEEAGAEKASAFAISQEEIDAVLIRGSGISQGKYRIYEQYLKKESADENIKFLKSEYGWGGAYPATSGISRNLDEAHDPKGIHIKTGYKVEPAAEIQLPWKKVEKRIGQLIKAERYLTPKEIEYYPTYRRELENRKARAEISKDIRSVLEDFYDFQTQLGNDVSQINQYILYDCCTAFQVGEKKTWRVHSEGDFILPLLRDALQTVIDADTHLTERAKAALSQLDTPLAKPFEPTYDELHPAPELPKEYRFSLGDTVFLGVQEYDILSLDDNKVVLSDPQYPLFTKEISWDEFNEKVKENPQNDKYLHIVDTLPSENKEPKAPLDERISQFIRDFEFYGDEQANIRIEADLSSPDTVAVLEERLLSYYEDTDDPGLTETIDGLLAELHEVQIEKIDIAEPAVVGRIDYLGSNGQVGESIEYTDAEKFASDIHEENQSGAPMVIAVYRQEDGSTIPTDFVQQLDPPPQGFRIEDNPHLEKVKEDTVLSEEQLDELPISTVVDGEVVTYPNAEAMMDAQEQSPVPATMDDVRAAIAQYIVDTFPSEDVDLRDQTYIELAYSSDGEGDHEIQVSADFEEFRFIFEWDNQEIAYIQCNDAADFIAHINNTSFDELIAYAESEHEKQQVQSMPEPPAPKAPKQHTTPHTLLPEIHAENRTNFKINDDAIGIGTPSERYENNVSAIRVLKTIEAENRLATPEEQSILSQYVGWGGLASCFEETNRHYEELKSLLTEDEYAAARESTLSAFYTPPVVIRSVYQALDNLGFKTGNILEPSCGVGNFMGMLPENMSTSNIYGVELDSISGRIAQQLYQRNNIAVQGFEQTNLPDSFFDVAVGNVPFGQFKVSDRRYDKYNFLIHDYFYARTLDKVRPGGVIAFITSKGTMDKENPSVRKYIAQRAELLGAIRLPNDTFKAAASTEVTADILFLQKRDSMTDIMPDWVYLGTDRTGLKMNQYFIDHPNMVLGEMKEVMGAHGPETACIPHADQSLAELLSFAVSHIQGHIPEAALDDLPDDEVNTAIPADPNVRNFSYTLVDGKIYFRENSIMNAVTVSATAESRIKGLIGIRDSVRKLIEYQTEDYPDSVIRQEQQMLNELYDDFSKKYGLINSRANNIAFNSDSSYYLLSSLEVLDDEGKFVRKADMFSKRTIKQRSIPTSVETASEALALSLAEKAKIDIPYMEQLTGKSEEQIVKDLRGVIFLNPVYGYGNSQAEQYLPADEYLSGNVREKLAWAKRSAELSPEEYTPNVQALEAVQPKDLTASEISVRLGATWLPPEDVQKFMFELFSTPNYRQWDIKVFYAQLTGEWSITGKSSDKSNVRANTTYGTERINGYKIIEDTLNLRDVRIFDYQIDENGKKIPILNKKETAIAQGKQELIKQAFADWIWTDPERRGRLTKLYNEKFNSNRPREYDGSHLNFVGMNPDISLRPHQVNAIAHILYGGNTLLAHTVGAGKTFEIVAAAMESKRLGLCQKSMIAVPNHLVEQWASEFLQLYPSANILVVTQKDFETKNRKKFCARIATGDFDAVIIGHSQFTKIPMSIERQKMLLEQQLDEVMEGIDELKRSKGEKFSIKQMERTRKQIKLKLDKLNDQSHKDDVVTFEELGVDRLFVDESHMFKNLAVMTKMRNVGGISQTEAQKSSDLYLKCRYLDELTGSKGVIFATGTPISNTMVEMYIVQRYLQYNTLQRNGLIHFDAWASTFGETVTAIELAPEGTGYRAKTRFARFYNLPELMSMFKEVADVQTADMLKLPVPEAHYHNVVLKPSEYQKTMVAELSKRAEKVRNRMVNSTEDNMLLITNDGRKLALDQRMINPMLPDDGTSKAAACADTVFSIWEKTAEQRSTQMIFCDLSTPHNDGRFNVYDDIRSKLISKGIPKEEIAYIHSADSEAKKKELFAKVRSGQVRVLLGSTAKMGAGTNAQKKLIALHHTDCPWRPSDLQQREGRIIRQGNENPEVEIYTYVTENTFDSYLYQLVESKQKFIGQIMTSKSPVRSAEDIDETALSYAEIKALCTGNPYIKEKMNLDTEVSKLRLLKSSHLSQRYALEDQIVKEFPQKIAAIEQRMAGYEADIALAAEHTHPNEDGFSPMIIEGTLHTEKKTAGSAILEICHAMTSPDPIPLGQYRGFPMTLHFDTMTKEFKITLQGTLNHSVSLGTDIVGNILRLDNLISGFPKSKDACVELLANTKVQFENAKVEVKKPFPREEELQEKSRRLDELNILLNMDKKENEIVDGEVGEEEPPEKCKSDRER